MSRNCSLFIPIYQSGNLVKEYGGIQHQAYGLMIVALFTIMEEIRVQIYFTKGRIGFGELEQINCINILIEQF